MKNFIIIILIFQIFTTSITAKSGIAFLPPYHGSWTNCTNDTAIIGNNSFSIKLVDYSIPATPGFGLYVPGNSSTDHIHGTGFSAYSYVRDSASIKTETELKNHYHGNYIDYCGTDEFAITQCNFEVKGLPNQTELEWCLVIENPFNNSQKANVSFSPDAISINPTNIDMTVSGIANNRNDEYLLLVLLIFSLIWNFDLS